MYTLHIGNKLYSSWSLRPWILLRELSIPFVEEVHPFAEGSNTAAFRAFSPSGKVPCLVAQGGETVWDSLAIAEYLADRHPGVWPKDAAARAWARCAAAEMHSGFQALRAHCSMHCALRVRLHATPPGVQADIDRIVELWTQGLRRFGGPLLAGAAFTAVDAFFAPVAIRFRGYGIALPQEAADYAARLLARDSLVEWMTEALREPWREEGHEQEIRAVGEVIGDLRAPGMGRL